jgi:hypothetical protein
MVATCCQSSVATSVWVPKGSAMERTHGTALAVLMKRNREMDVVVM